MLHLVLVSLSAAAVFGQSAANPPQLKTRSDPPAATTNPSAPTQPQWIVPAGTRIPIQLRQPVSTKSAQPGDAIYAQTSFPILVDGGIAIPPGTYVQGVVDAVKRAGRIKGTAELRFHLTKFIYPNGYTVDLAGAIDRVPGDTGSNVKEPGTVKHEPEKGKDLERVGHGASIGGAIGSIAGAAASPSIRGIGVGGVAGIAAGTLIGILARGTDVRFDSGTSVEIALNEAIAVERARVSGPANLPTP